MECFMALKLEQDVSSHMLRINAISNLNKSDLPLEAGKQGCWNDCSIPTQPGGGVGGCYGRGDRGSFQHWEHGVKRLRSMGHGGGFSLQAYAVSFYSKKNSLHLCEAFLLEVKYKTKESFMC